MNDFIIFKQQGALKCCDHAFTGGEAQDTDTTIKWVEHTIHKSKWNPVMCAIILMCTLFIILSHSFLSFEPQKQK